MHEITHYSSDFKMFSLGSIFTRYLAYPQVAEGNVMKSF